MYLSTYLYMYLSIYLSIYLFIYRCIARQTTPVGRAAEGIDLVSMASVQASVAFHRSNHLIITSHHPRASIHQTKLTDKQIRCTTEQRHTHTHTGAGAAAQMNENRPATGATSPHLPTQLRIATRSERTNETKAKRFSKWTTPQPPL